MQELLPDGWWMTALAVLLHLGLAFLLALPIALDREKATRLAGLRTFPLVALGSCAFVLTARMSLGESAQAQARIIQGLITGIGFTISAANFLSLRLLTPVERRMGREPE